MSKRRITIAALCALLALLSIGVWASLQSQDAQPIPSATPAPTAIPPSPTPSPSPSPTAPPQQTRERTLEHQGPFELPLQGATGFATIELNLRSGPSVSSEQIGTLAPGDSFRILGEEGSYWRVSDGSRTGYAAHRYCMVNLPDIIPSIVYDNTNAYDSKLVSSGKPLPGITGEGLYENTAYNERLGSETFIMPVLYEMAPKIYAAQQAALADGNSLKIYEAYRPHQVQRKAVNALAALAEQDSEVRAGISTAPWKVSWFVSQGTSMHQRGCAIDVSLVNVDGTEERTCGPYAYRAVTDYTEYTMPTPIHELSIAAAVFNQPVSSTSTTAWKSASPSSSMNRAARTLQKYCTDAGLTPLASEWWHFNDLVTYERIKNNAGKGESVLTELHSVVPG